ncbi:MAG: DUF3419 family protein, partial [Pseudomonadota bacterium]
REVLRTARLGARVIFRTAGDDSPLETAIAKDVLWQFSYDPSASVEAVKKDRSSIYGGFHVYTFEGKNAAKRSDKSEQKVA